MREGKDVSRAQYAIRFHDIATEQIRAEKERYALLSGDAVATEWAERLLKTVRELSYKGPFLQLAPESVLFPFPVHVLRYQRRRGAPTYRVLFTMEDHEDGRRIMVLSVRHGARAPMTQAEANAIPL